MKSPIKSPSQVKTLSSIVDHRRSRSSSGALMELAMLEIERQRLVLEQERMAARNQEINRRLESITNKSALLYQFVERPDAIPAVKGNESMSATAGLMPGLRVRTRTLNY
ncbi:hypothetical protein [Ectothiorhodospira shaposhnikovii]|uniref:hypothetical protein n=1 Tax=Ectothiorhodospira shaposhnikovii TaxID=1054 RepID=UPI001EE948E0|nr:hypothetical protein [Ectothiorhodospira shaposhnikovii]MCG5514367.1 hypothetical protein [Ectothiorhodospira shaposhnikovii]